MPANLERNEKHEKHEDAGDSRLKSVAGMHQSHPTTQEGAAEHREGLKAMVPQSSVGADAVLPKMPPLVDVGTAQALYKIDSAGGTEKIPAGGGPYQALRPAFSEKDIPNEDLSKAAAVIRDRAGANHEFKTGEALPTGKAYTSDDAVALNRAELRDSLHMPVNSTDQQVDDKMAANNAADLRKGLGLPANASDAEVDKTMADNNMNSLRKDLGLGPNASLEDVQKKMAENNLADLRKNLGLPADANFADVQKKMADDNKASLRKDLGLKANASDADVDAALLTRIYEKP